MVEEASAHSEDAPMATAAARLIALPAPQALERNQRASQKKRIKDISSKLLQHKKKACLGEDELQSLMQEMDQLHKELASEADNGDQAEQVHGGLHRRLELKKEIKEVERQIKQFKKLSSTDQKQLSACMERLDALKSELIQVQRHVIFSLHVDMMNARSSPQRVTLALGDKISLAGLSETEAICLWDWFRERRDVEFETGMINCGPWYLWQHIGVHAAALCSPDLPTLSDELREAAARCPHVICARMACLRARGGICTVLRDFKGALLLIEDADEDANELETACLLNSIGIKERWRKQAETGALVPVDLPAPLQGEVIGDIKLKDIKDDPLLASLFADMEQLYPQEFDDDVLELLGTEGVRLGLLVPVGSHAKDPVNQVPMLGFIIYVFWGPPLKTMSISRVAVPKKYQMHGFGRLLVRWAIEKAKSRPRHECTRVSLLATSKAVPFYTHLNFTRTPDEEAQACDSPGSVWMEYHIGRAVRH